MTKVINLFGGSGIGKSTTAADLFAKLKQKGEDAELVQEFVKKWAWQGKVPSGFDQVYIFGKQAQSESMLYGKLDFIVTDSPLLLSGFYEEYHLGREITIPAILNFLDYARDNNVEHVNYLLRRYKPFNPKGRFETEEQAREIDSLLEAFLNKHKIDYTTLEVEDEKRAEVILEQLFKTEQL